MIRCCGLTFEEWASLFPDGIFVKAAIVYADGSGTHDPTGKQEGSDIPIIAGIAAPPSEWSSFNVQWRAVLKSYKVEYFHSRELRAADAALKHNKPRTPELLKNQYLRAGWDLKTIDEFLLTMAKIATRGNKVIIAGAIRIPVFHEIKAALEISNPQQIQFGDYPFIYCMGEFFKYYHQETGYRWGNFKCPVSFFFDQDTPRWKAAVFEVFDAYKSKDPRMSGLTFEDKKKHPHWPLQAADMIAYRIHALAQDLKDGTFKLTEVDRILLQSLPKRFGLTRPQTDAFLKVNPSASPAQLEKSLDAEVEAKLKKEYFGT